MVEIIRQIITDKRDKGIRPEYVTGFDLISRLGCTPTDKLNMLVTGGILKRHKTFYHDAYSIVGEKCNIW